MVRVRSAVVLSCAVLAAGCGDGDDATAPTDDETTVDTASDQQAAEDALLVLSDMPAGWIDTDDDAGAYEDADVAYDEAFAECLGVDISLIESDESDGDATADSAVEPPKGDATVRSDVQVNATVSETEDLMKAFTGDGATTCFRDSIEAYLDASGAVGVGELSVEPLELEPVGDQSVAVRVMLPIETDQGTTVLLSDAVVAAKGRAVVQMEFGTEAQPLATAEALRLTELVLDRIPSDL
jgi:hypothetical protein